ncbi:MAG: DUF4332 domain-containing protein [Deltaproteobacteria bacterium]|nr:DUF4332 domain-containing protein [Deltaproteobacteria bacterium]
MTMSLALIAQLWLCLLSAFGLGLFVGWLWKQLLTSRKRDGFSRPKELDSTERGGVTKERESNAALVILRNQVTTATEALQKREEALAGLTTDLAEKIATLSGTVAQTEKLHTRLAETEATLQQNLQSTRTLEAEVKALRNELGNKPEEFRLTPQHFAEPSLRYDTTTESEERITELMTHLQSVLQEKETVISGLHAQVLSLEPLKTKLSECTSTLQETETYYQQEVRDKEAEIIRLQAQLASFQHSVAEGAENEAKLAEFKVRYQAIVREKDAMLTRLQSRIAGLELLLHRKSDAITVPVQFSPSVHHRSPTSFPRDSILTRAKAFLSDLTEIRSLDEAYLPKLREAGIATRAVLLERGRTVEGRNEISAKTGIPAELILQWVRHADLLRLNGMSVTYAELLDAAGVDSVTALTKCTAETLHQKFLDVNASRHLSRILPILAQIRDWIEQARNLPHTSEELHLSVAGQTS